MNVRTNHVHLVVAIDAGSPDAAVAAFKANATRQMRSDGSWKYDHSPWSKGASKRRLWHEESVAKAVIYVVDGQGDDLPDFL
jgi:hypothetical protein